MGSSRGVLGLVCSLPHASGNYPQEWRIDLNERLRTSQYINIGGFAFCSESGSEERVRPGHIGRAVIRLRS